jgi:DNA-binding NarL/FixJ family response regulator
MRILIADDSALVRRGVVDILKSRQDWVICGEAENGAETLRMSRTLRPDLILLDISMPDMNGLEVTRLLRQEWSGAKVLVISQHDPLQLQPHAIEAGALGCIDKSRLAADLVSAIEEVEGGTQAPA